MRQKEFATFNNGKASGNVFFAAYVGPSMNPTLREPEIMEIMPYESTPMRVGDVVFFLSPQTDHRVVHRIIRVTPPSISTLGDNNTQEDALLLQPKSIEGKVIAAWRGQERRKITGGNQGWLTGCWLHWRRPIDLRLSLMLNPIYQFLSQWGLIARVLPASFRPRVVVFHTQGGDQFQLLLGRRIIGRYDEKRQRWQIQRPYRLFVDVRTLPGQQGKDQMNRQDLADQQRS